MCVCVCLGVEKRVTLRLSKRFELTMLAQCLTWVVCQTTRRRRVALGTATAAAAAAAAAARLRATSHYRSMGCTGCVGGHGATIFESHSIDAESDTFGQFLRGVKAVRRWGGDGGVGSMGCWRG